MAFIDNVCRRDHDMYMREGKSHLEAYFDTVFQQGFEPFDTNYWARKLKEINMTY